MALRETTQTAESDLFRQELVNLINLRHPLVQLAQKIDWDSCDQRFGGLYKAGIGRPGHPIRLMVGLQLLKHTSNLSDEEVVAVWVENPYWQHFCGEQYFRHDFPIDPSLMTGFRKRIGESGCEFILGLTVQAGLATRAVAKTSLAVVNVDTTVQDKAVAFLTDARLLHKARMALVRQAKKLGIKLRQSYERVGLASFVRSQRYAHARQINRAKAQNRKLRTYLGRVIRDIERKTQSDDTRTERLDKLLEIAKRIHSQPRKRSEGDPPKLYSVHAPEVECIAKGKIHKQYEFGVKVGIVSTSKESFVVGAKSLPGNPYDGHTLQACIEQAQRVSGIQPKEAYTDRGYRGHGCDSSTLKVWIAGAKRGVTAAIQRKLKRRNAVEPVIGHLKSDGRLARNFLKGIEGDAMNALLCGAGHNLRKILRKLRLLCAQLGITLRQFLNNTIACSTRLMPQAV
ncbi:IS5 family transposase [Polaromonas sp.]|uniref:IS5 family transposase n=1 Tax=Polaromonas sp. TaxID=1869339 RepID=UPI002FCB12A0